MHKITSSYSKLCSLALIIVVSSLILLGVLTVSISSAIFKKSKFNELKSAGDLFISCISKEYNNSGSFDSEMSTQILYAFTSEYQINSIYIYNNGGECIGSSDRNTNSSLSSEFMKSIDYKYFLDFDSNGFSKKVPQIMYSCRFPVRYGGSNKWVYASMYGDTDDISSFTVEMTLIYTILAVICTAVSYVLLRHRLKKYSSYENTLLRISEMYAKGDFSEKLAPDITGAPQIIANHINALAANVEKSEETSKTFIANVSHELRTPMTTIGGFVDGILDSTIPKNRRNEYLVLVSNEIQRLRILISSMLNMSRFESGTMRPNFRETNITDLLIKTVLMFEKKIEDKSLQVEELDSERLIAEVDSDLIQQVLYNLIENAVKFVNEGGTLSFSFEKENGMCTIGIKNTGEGLKDSEIQQVFDRFYKTDSSRGKDTTGLGLGLSISRKIIHLHKGHIVVKSVYGEYTEFIIQIPEKQELPKDKEK